MEIEAKWTRGNKVKIQENQDSQKQFCIKSYCNIQFPVQFDSNKMYALKIHE